MRINWFRIICWFAIAVFLVLFWAGVFHLLAASKIGPWVGLRIPIFDNVKKGYWYFKMDPLQFQTTPDPGGTSDGILNLKFPQVQTYIFGRGFVTVEIAGKPTQVDFDTAYGMHRILTTNGLPPVLGSTCQDTGALWIGQEGIRACIQNEQQTGFVWAGILTGAWGTNTLVSYGLSSGTTGNGTAILDLSMSASKSSPSGLQWEMAFSTSDVISISVVSGPTAIAAGKTVSCSSGTVNPVRCLIYGANQNPILNGVAARVTVQTKPGVVTTSLTLQNVVSASAGANEMASAIIPGGGIVTAQ